MMFNVEEADRRVAGWLIADNPSAEPTLALVLGGGRERISVPAVNFRPDLKNAGLHKTGNCGFVLDPETYPGLSREHYVEIYDASSNMLLFRWAPNADAPIRLFHLETQTWPVYTLARHAAPMVQLIYSDAEMIAEETLANLLYLHWDSILVSGAILLRNYEGPLGSQKYRRTILLCDPFRELAARVVRLKMLAGEAGGAVGWRRMGQGDLVELFAEVDVADTAQLGRAFRRMSDEQFFAFTSPTLRKLVAKTQDAPLDKHHVGLGLDALADFDVVGFSDELDAYVDGLEALLGRDGLPRTTIEGPSQLPAVMAALNGCRPAHELIQFDLVLYDIARGAFDKARMGEDEAAA